MKSRVTPEQQAEALNPELSETEAFLCGKMIKIVAMPLSKEQVFLKQLRSIVPQTLDGQAVIQALIDADPAPLCSLAVKIAKNSGKDFTEQQIMDSTRLVDIVGVIEKQVEKQGYLDFLLRIAAMLPGALTAKQ